MNPAGAGDHPQGTQSLSPVQPLVLVVDDQPANVELVRAVLEHDGFEVVGAVDAAEADLEVHRRRPSLVLLDLQLPREDGLTLLARWRADPLTAPLRVVAFTAFAMTGDRERFLAAGCDGYLAKPIDVGRFAAQVRALLVDGGGTDPLVVSNEPGS